MVMPPEHAQAPGLRRALSGRERWMVRAVVGLAVVLAIVLAISIAAGGKSSANGCIYATIPGPVGAQEVSQCGSRARETCRSAAAPGEFTPQAARVIEEQCRKAGLSVGR